MNHLRLILTVTLLTVASPIAAAAPSTVITLQSVDARVRAQNPDLAAAEWMIAEAVGLQKQAGRLQNPQLQFQHSDSFEERTFTVGLSQAFPVTQRLRLEKDQGATQVQAAQKEVSEVANQLVGQARGAVIELLVLREREALLRQQATLSKELADFIAKAAETGEGSPLDAAQAKLQTLQFQTELRKLTAETAQWTGILKNLLGMDLGQPLTVSGSLPGLQFPEGSSVEGRPALEVARLAVIEAEQQAEIERARRYADVSTSLFLGAQRVVDQPVGAEREAIVGMSLSVPLPWWNKNEGNIEAAEARAQRRRKEVYALKRSIGLQAEAAHAEMLEWAKLAHEVQNDLLPQAEEQSALSEQVWRSGQGDLLTVLRSRDQLLGLAASRLDALRNFHLAHVRFQTVLGNP